MSINLFRWLSFNAIVLILIAVIAIYVSGPTPTSIKIEPPPTTIEVSPPPQAVIISLCGETKGVFVTSYPVTWTDQFTEQTPEFTALTLIAREAGEVYNFESGSDADCKQLGFPDETRN